MIVSWFLCHCAHATAWTIHMNLCATDTVYLKVDKTRFVINCSVYNRSRKIVVEVLLYTRDEALVCARDETHM